MASSVSLIVSKDGPTVLSHEDKQSRVIVVSSLFIVTRDLYSLLLRFSQTEDVFERIASTVTTPSEINSRSSFIIRDE